MKQQQGHRPPSARWWSSDPAVPSGQPSHGSEPAPLRPQPRAAEVGLGKPLPLSGDGMCRSAKGRTGPAVGGPDQARGRPRAQGARCSRGEAAKMGRRQIRPCTVWIYSSPARSAAAGTGALPATMLTFEMGEEESHRRKLVEGGPLPPSLSLVGLPRGGCSGGCEVRERGRGGMERGRPGGRRERE
jgi:hypothetical protein